MKGRLAMAAVIAAIISFAAFIGWLGKDYSYQRDYKDVYEQMRMEQMITGREIENESKQSVHRTGKKI